MQPANAGHIKLLKALRAPQDGTVRVLAGHARGRFLAPGEQMMLIVPEADNLLVEVRVAPQDIDQVQVDQIAMLRFPNFNQRTTPEVDGTAVRIAPDVTRDVKSGLLY